MLEGFGLSQYADSYAGGLSGDSVDGRDHAGTSGRAEGPPLDEPMAGVHPSLAHKIGDQLTRLVDSA